MNILATKLLGTEIQPWGVVFHKDNTPLIIEKICSKFLQLKNILLTSDHKSIAFAPIAGLMSPRPLKLRPVPSL